MPAKRIHPGFTLIELLVVIVIIIGLVSLMFPTLRSLVRSNQTDTAVNTVSVAAQAIRAYATQNTIGSGSVSVDKTASIPILTTSVSREGTALLFTPSGEIRLTQHNPTASETNNVCVNATANANEKRLLILKDNGTDGLNKPLLGFFDIAGRDAIKLPTGVGALGIVRDTHSSSNGNLRLITPPFALRFNSYGQLVPGDRSINVTYVYYDGNQDGRYNTDNPDTNTDPSRPNNYSPKTYDTYYNTAADTANKRQIALPFDKIETVIGVVLYNKADMDSANLATDPLQGLVLPTATQNWIFKTDNLGRFENAQVIFFNRYTGQAIREGVTGQ